MARREYCTVRGTGGCIANLELKTHIIENLAADSLVILTTTF